MNVPIKPCAFCGSSRVNYVNTGDDSWVVCSGCLAQGPTDGRDGPAIERWNAIWVEPPVSISIARIWLDVYRSALEHAVTPRFASECADRAASIAGLPEGAVFHAADSLRGAGGGS